MDRPIGPYWVRFKDDPSGAPFLADLDGFDWATFGTGDRFPVDALVAVAPATPPGSGSGDFSIGSSVWPGTSKLLEEMGELGQVLGKLIAVHGADQHWDGDLRKRLVEEIGDVRAALRFFVEHCMSDEEARRVDERAADKYHLFRRWHANPTRP